MIVNVVIHLPKDVDSEQDVTFRMDLGHAPVPARKTSVALGTVLTVVKKVQYQCANRGYIESRDHTVLPVEVEVTLALPSSSRGRKSKRSAPLSAQALYLELRSLACVTELHVSGLDFPA